MEVDETGVIEQKVEIYELPPEDVEPGEEYEVEEVEVEEAEGEEDVELVDDPTYEEKPTRRFRRQKSLEEGSNPCTICQRMFKTPAVSSFLSNNVLVTGVARHFNLGRIVTLFNKMSDVPKAY